MQRTVRHLSMLGMVFGVLGCAPKPADPKPPQRASKTHPARLPAQWMPPSVSLREDPTTVSFSARRGLILVEAFVDGRDEPLSLAVDTGASLGTLSQAVVDELGLTTTRPQPVQTVTSSIRLPAARVPPMRIGGLEIERRWVYVTDEVETQETCDGPYRFDGVLGADVLWQLITVIDSRASRIHFGKLAAPMRRGEQRIPVRPHADLVFLATIGLGGKDTTVLLDTGSAGAITVSSAQLPSLTTPPNTTTYPFRGVLMSDASGPIEGGVLFQVPVVLGSAEARWVDGLALPAEHHITNLGYGFLREYHVTIDGPSAELRLLPRTDLDRERRPTAGFNFTREADHSVVGVVVDGSAVARAGVEPGDRVVELAGVRLEDVDFAEGCALQERLREQKLLRVVFEHEGAELEVSLIPTPRSFATSGLDDSDAATPRPGQR
ncbi:MAG: aspartyl protease family protein [Nannocystaceae bacterium]|nr:aspartyl protease family protein [Nannocystaceae bacterium]